ncbi:MAG: hypothetical protein O3C51_17880 [Planctomycetota bacterium]|nr:hypothetical protein [Planctomycetota bacterium]MDA1223162.1 hypothetical protein [Planctomycetota bacterium]
MNRIIRTLPLVAFSLLAAGCGDISVPTVENTLPQTQPAWFDTLGGADAQFLFVTRLRAHFEDEGQAARLDDEGRLEVNGPGGQQFFVVAGLAERAAVTPPDDWDALIAEHFDAVAALRAAVGDVEVPKTFDEARPRLRVRIHPEGYLADAGLRPEDVVHRVDLPGTRTILILDGDETALVVPRDDVLRWGQEPDNVLAVAFANTRRALEQDVEVTAKDFEGIGTLHVLTGRSFYAASAVLGLEEWPELLGKHGAIVAVPWRHGAFVYPFEDARVRTVVPALHRYVARIVEGTKGPISTDLWWRRPDGIFEAIDVREAEDGGVEVIPPAEMARILSTLR